MAGRTDIAKVVRRVAQAAGCVLCVLFVAPGCGAYIPARLQHMPLCARPVRSASSPGVGNAAVLSPGCREHRAPTTSVRRPASRAPEGGGGAGDDTKDANLGARGQRAHPAQGPKSIAKSSKTKKTGTDPKMMLLPEYSMFPTPPAQGATAGNLDWNQTVHSGGLALLTLYHEAQRPVVAHYWYKHCAMCKIMKPVITRVVREYESQIYYVDVEISYNKKTMSHAGVRSIPAVQVFKDGKMVSHFSGLQTVSGMRREFSVAVDGGSEGSTDQDIPPDKGAPAQGSHSPTNARRRS